MQTSIKYIMHLTFLTQTFYVVTLKEIILAFNLLRLNGPFYINLNILRAF